MLTNSLQHIVRIGHAGYQKRELDADITDTKSGGHDAWYALLEAVPDEIKCSPDTQRQVEFLQDVLMAMPHLREQVTGIRHDPHGLLDFLLDREVQFDPAQEAARLPIDVVINGVKYHSQIQPIYAKS